MEPDAAAAGPPAPSLRGRLLVPGAVAALAFLAFAPSLPGGFLNWDDRAFLLETTEWREPGPGSVAWAFTTFHVGHWQPLTWLSFTLNHALGGLDPLGYRLGNLLLHAAGAVLFHGILLRLWPLVLPSAGATGPRERIAAGLGALLFAVHPLRAESVAWITERRNVLAAALLLAALLAWLHGVRADLPDRARGRWRLLAVALHALSLLAAAWGVTFPLVLLVLDLWPLRRFSRGALLEKAPFLLLASAAGVLALLAQEGTGALLGAEALGPLDRGAVALYGLGWYARKTLLPTGLAPLHELPLPFDPAAPAFLLSAGLVLLAAALLVLLRRRRPGWLAAGALYAILPLPVLGLFQSGPQLVADRYSYLCCLPLAGLAGAGVLAALRRGPRAGAGAALLALSVAGVLFALTLGQAALWTDSRALWGRCLEVHPGSRIGANNMGMALLREGAPDGAEPYFRSVLERVPDSTEARLNLSLALRAQGRLGESKAVVEEALLRDPGDARARGFRARDLAQEKRYGEAIEVFGDLLRSERPRPEWERGMGLALAGAGAVADALPHLRRALAMDALDGGNLDALATVLSMAGKPGEAERILREGIGEGASFAFSRNLLGTLLAGRGEVAEAEREFRESVRLAPLLPEPTWNLAMLLAGSGRAEEAIRLLEGKVARTPWDEEARRGLEALRRGERPR
jgi:Flp pilus assembly protein TadD